MRKSGPKTVKNIKIRLSQLRIIALTQKIRNAITKLFSKPKNEQESFLANFETRTARWGSSEAERFDVHERAPSRCRTKSTFRFCFSGKHLHSNDHIVVTPFTNHVGENEQN